jgi:hypothetical protein
MFKIARSKRVEIDKDAFERLVASEKERDRIKEELRRAKDEVETLTAWRDHFKGQWELAQEQGRMAQDERQIAVGTVEQLQTRVQLFAKVRIDKNVAEEVRMVLGELSEDSPVLRAFLAVVKEQFQMESHAALMAGVPDSDRQYNAGRAAAVSDLMNAIAQCREEGEALLRGKRGAVGK